MTTSDQESSSDESSSDIMLRLVGLYREAAQATAETYHHVKQAADLFEIDPSTLKASRRCRRPGQQNNGWRSWTTSPPALKPPIAVTPARKSNGSLTEWPLNGSSTN
jgi:hypothetical protein